MSKYLDPNRPNIFGQVCNLHGVQQFIDGKCPACERTPFWAFETDDCGCINTPPTYPTYRDTRHLPNCPSYVAEVTGKAWQTEAKKVKDYLGEYCRWPDEMSFGDAIIAEIRRLNDESNEQHNRIRVLERALELADRFITNGIRLGFIQMPDKDTPDSAHETPEIIRAALNG